MKALVIFREIQWNPIRYIIYTIFTYDAKNEQHKYLQTYNNFILKPTIKQRNRTEQNN